MILYAKLRRLTVITIKLAPRQLLRLGLCSLILKIPSLLIAAQDRNFFTRFKEGLKDRTGQEVKGDIPIDYKILHEILFRLKRELLDPTTNHERRRWIASVGALFTITFVLALRGNEILMLVL